MVLAPHDALRHGAALFDGGDPWHAHEVWEAAWKADHSRHRDAWKGLIQLAAAVYHLRRGHPGPVPTLLVRAHQHWLAHGHHLSRRPAWLATALLRLADHGTVPRLGPWVASDVK